MGGKSKPATQTEKSSPWEPQADLLKYGFDEAKRLYQNVGPEYYKGSTVAPFAPEQQQAFDMTTRRAIGRNQTMQAAEGFTRDVLGGKYAGDPYQGQVFQNIQQQVLPAVNSQFMGSGRYGSGLHADTMTRALTESFAPYASNMYQQGLDRMGQAANMAPTFAQNDYTDIGALQSVGAQRQDLAQREIEDAKARWDYQQSLPYDKLGQFLNNIGGNYGGTVVSTARAAQPSMFSQIAGAGVGLLGSALSGGMFSDRRLKEDVRDVGTLHDGTTIYSWRYKWGGPVHFGVMADEVEADYPEAVSIHASGFKTVDYGKLADGIAR